MHQAELHLAVALATKLRRKVCGPELLLLDLLLERANRSREPGFVRFEDLERINLVAHEFAHPFQLGFELRLGREIPGHLKSPKRCDRGAGCPRRSCRRWESSIPRRWGPPVCRAGEA